MSEMQKLLMSKQSKVGARNSKKVERAIKKAGKDLPLLAVKLSSGNSKKTSNGQFGELQIVSE